MASAHRTPQRVQDFVKNSDAQIFIAAAGMCKCQAAFRSQLWRSTAREMPRSLQYDDELAKKLIAYREQMAETIELKDKNLKKEFF